MKLQTQELLHLWNDLEGDLIERNLLTSYSQLKERACQNRDHVAYMAYSVMFQMTFELYTHPMNSTEGTTCD